tara:strand:- start:514 stop:885 length:372 start_codon:yes stop_codon:yes gene_type:complete
MTYLNKKYITTKSKSVIIKLRDEGKINDQLLSLISGLSLEDLIAVKLELACHHVNNRLYGFSIWKQANRITKEAILKFAISTTKSKKDAARFLGITYLELKQVLKKFNIDNYFKEETSIGHSI